MPVKYENQGGGGGGGGTITGGGTPEQVAFWSGATAISGDATFFFNSATKLLTVQTLLAPGSITSETAFLLKETGVGADLITIQAPVALAASYTLTLPIDDGTPSQFLQTDGSGVLSWVTGNSGDVVGPAGATDEAVARFDGVTGKLIQNSVVIISDLGVVTGVTDLTATGTIKGAILYATGSLQLEETGAGTDIIIIQAPASIAGNYTLTLPIDDGTPSQFLQTDGAGVLSWATNAGGDVTGPASSTDNAIVRFDGITGKLIQDSVVLVSDTGDITAVGIINAAVGAQTAPTYSFTGDTNTGMYNVAADTLGFTTGGTVNAQLSTTSFFSALQILTLAGTAAAPSYSISGDTNTGIYQVGADNLGISAGGTLRFDVSTTQTTSALPLQCLRLGVGAAPNAINLVTFTQPVATSGSPSMIVATGGAHTTLTASELIDVNYNLSGTAQFTTGATIATQRAIVMQGRTYSATAATQTITNAITLSIGAPVAGTNASITNPWSLSLDSNIRLTQAAGNKFQATTVSGFLSFQDNLAAGASTVGFVFTSGTTRTAGRLFDIQNNGTNRVSIGFTGSITETQGAATSGIAQLEVLTEAASTGQTLSTEATAVDWNFSATKTWATGAISTQRHARIRAPTYAFAGASTITDAATVYIEGAPIAGTNATITNSYALWIDSGTTRLDGIVQTLSAIRNADGSAAVPSYSFTSDIDTGIYSVGANDLGFTTGGTLRFDISTTAITETIPFRQADGATAGPSYAFTNSTNSGMYLISAGRLAFSNAGVDTIIYNNPTQASAAGATLDRINMLAQTVTITGATNITTATGFNFVQIGRPTYSAGSALTITNAASLYISNSPLGAGAGPATITNAYSVWVDAGTSRFDGRVNNAKGADVASANDLTLGADGNTFGITGTTKINAITTAGWTAGSHICLIFSAVTTVKNNTAGGAGTAVLFLAGSADLTTAANTVLGLVYDGTQWQETYRKVA